MTNGEKIKETFPNIILIGTVMIHKPTEQVLASSINYNWLNAEYEEPTTKNNLGVDLISRTEVLKLIYDYKENHSENRKEYPINYGTLLDMIRWVRNLPSVTPQEPIFDKIRAEIEQKLGTHGYVSLYNRAIHDVLKIIDKYKAESEG